MLPYTDGSRLPSRFRFGPCTTSTAGHPSCAPPPAFDAALARFTIQYSSLAELNPTDCPLSSCLSHPTEPNPSAAVSFVPHARDQPFMLIRKSCREVKLYSRNPLANPL